VICDHILVANAANVYEEWSRKLGLFEESFERKGIQPGWLAFTLYIHVQIKVNMQTDLRPGESREISRVCDLERGVADIDGIIVRRGGQRFRKDRPAGELDIEARAEFSKLLRSHAVAAMQLQPCIRHVGTRTDRCSTPALKPGAASSLGDI
jgi:hypothetical protein